MATMVSSATTPSQRLPVSERAGCTGAAGRTLMPVSLGKCSAAISRLALLLVRLTRTRCSPTDRDKQCLQVGMRGGHARPGYGHHPAVHLDPVPVRVEEVEGVASAAANETLLASLGGVHVGSTDDLHSAGAYMVEREQPVLARVDLEGDVIEAWVSADTGIG